jgi:hypothetical protein
MRRLPGWPIDSSASKPSYSSSLAHMELAAASTATVFGDAVVATAILDRLLHHSHVVTIRRHSYRLRVKRRSGLLQKTTAPEPTGTLTQ